MSPHEGRIEKRIWLAVPLEVSNVSQDHNQGAYPLCRHSLVRADSRT
jgi:hypothetical protein